MKEKKFYIALEYDTVLQEQIVSSAPQAVGSFSLLEDFDSLVYNLSLTLYQQMLLKIDGKESMRAKSGFRIFKYMDGLSNTAFSWTIS